MDNGKQLKYYFGMAVISKDGKYGYVNEDGEEVIPCMYDDAMPFFKDRARVRLNGKCGYIGRNNETIIELKYASLQPCSEGRYYYRNEEGGLLGLMDHDGHELTSCRYYRGENFVDGLAVVMRDWKRGLINREGKEVLPAEYHRITRKKGQEFLWIEDREGKVGLTSKDGQFVTPCRYDMIFDFMYGTAIAKRNGKFVYLDENGKELDKECNIRIVPAEGNTGEENTGEENPGEENPAEGNPEEENPAEGNPGEEKPGEE